MNPLRSPAIRGAAMCAALLIVQVPARAETRHALVMGNAAYRNARALVNPGRDAQALAQTLAKLDFRVQPASDAGLREMKDALRKFTDAVGEGDVALFYYAGHGVQIGGRNFLVPIDARMEREYEVPDETLALDTVLRALDERGPRLSILVLDCCRDNPFSRGWRGGRGGASVGMAAVKDAPRGTFIAYATSPDRVAEDGEGDHSPYTRALLEALAVPVLDLENVFKRVGKKVADDTRGAQEPWYNSKFYDEFRFAVPSKRQSPQSATRERPYVNSLGMKFVPVPGTKVLFCVWETRVRDYAEYAAANPGVDASWRDPRLRGQPLCPSDDCPVVNVNWEDARAFCRWLSRQEQCEYRLPTDREWDAALRGEVTGEPEAAPQADSGEAMAHPWGAQWPPPKGTGNYSASLGVDRFEYTAPVGTFAPNPQGLFDLGGNVWEWSEDWYGESEPGLRALRGGSWFDGVEGILRSSYRGADRSNRFDFNGFRCVLVRGQ